MIAFLLVLACGPTSSVQVLDREVGAACGTCVFDVPEGRGCFWAVEMDGRFHAVGGEKPSDDMVEAHGPEGMCSVERKAVVSGSIRPDGRFLATKFELLPFDGSGRTARPHDH